MRNIVYWIIGLFDAGKTMIGKMLAEYKLRREICSYGSNGKIA